MLIIQFTSQTSVFSKNLCIWEDIWIVEHHQVLLVSLIWQDYQKRQLNVIYELNGRNVLSSGSKKADA